MQTQQTNETGAEQARLQEDREGRAAWKKWGPYLSERQWGTVREDYSPSGDAWNYFTHDQAQYRAYRWGEDGLAGISDNRQLLCFAVALWNGKDPILKERLFDLTNSEGNHGEDVKEYYFYVDSTPTHSYMKYLYKYPQAEYPYQAVIDANRTRNKQAAEYELLDTGIFDEDRRPRTAGGQGCHPDGRSRPATGDASGSERAVRPQGKGRRDRHGKGGRGGPAEGRRGSTAERTRH
jgi:hypothetical protein